MTASIVSKKSWAANIKLNSTLTSTLVGFGLESLNNHPFGSHPYNRILLTFLQPVYSPKSEKIIFSSHNLILAYISLFFMIYPLIITCGKIKDSIHFHYLNRKQLGVKLHGISLQPRTRCYSSNGARFCGKRVSTLCQFVG